MPDPCAHREKFDSFDDKLDDIKTIVTATNGRVRALEMWRAIISTAVVVIIAIFLLMVAVVGPKTTAALTGLMAVEASKSK